MASIILIEKREFRIERQVLGLIHSYRESNLNLAPYLAQNRKQYKDNSRFCVHNVRIGAYKHPYSANGKYKRKFLNTSQYAQLFCRETLQFMTKKRKF
jgi:hypothetical protein